ncbi:hypothetical protein [Roseiflexus castenholzii]|uniref:hypothetical protein n=1 Tax=Roseiflexus castenholzii TaxID=120962 RepID=UPI003C7B3782
MVSTLRLSTDELAFALLLSDQPVAAQQVLVSSIGRELSKEEAQGRLSAAGNALFGQGLVDIRDDGSIVSSPVLTEVSLVLTRAAATLRFTLSAPTGQRALSYHFLDDAIYEHWVDRGVAHVVSRVSEDAIMEGCVAFFNLSDLQEIAAVTGMLPDPVFRQALGQRDVTATIGLLRDYGIAEDTGVLLAEDMVHTQAIGDMLAIYYHGDNRAPMSDEGCLVVLGQQRFWLFQPVKQGEDVQVMLLPGTIDSMREQVQRLTRVCRQIAAREAAVARAGKEETHREPAA